MSFRCQECKKPQPQRTKPKIVVSKIRQITYIHEGISGNPKTEGWEIVETLLVCDECFKKYQNFQPKVVEKVTRKVKH